MKSKNFRITLGYLNGDMHVPNNKNIIFLLNNRKMEFKTSYSNSWNFSNRIDTMNLRLFLRKVYRMLITIKVKSEIAFVAINNSPCSIQKGSTKDNRHVVHHKYNKVSQNSNISNNNGHILADTDRYGSLLVSHLQRYFSRCEFIQVKSFI